MRPGSLLWLLRNEVKVRWRELIGETKASTLILTGAAIFVAVHLMLWGISRPLRGVLTSPLPPEAVFFAAIVVLVLLPFGVAAGINHAVVALFDRGDLDLLASSPVGSRIVFASRVLAVAAGVFVGLGVFMLPLASLGVLIGVPQLLGAVPTLVALSVVCACLGMLITLLLVWLLGPRRARTAAQLLAALSGVALFVASQLPALLGGRVDVGERLLAFVAYFEPGAVLAADSLVWLPVRVLLLDPLGTLTALAGAGLVLWATVELLHRAFARGIGLVEGRRAHRRRAPDLVRFAPRGTLRLLLDKEWKLILRDPFLVSQVLLQLFYLLPAAYLLLFADTSFLGELDLGPALAVMVVVLGGTMTSALARIAIAGEEAQDLLAASPVGGRMIRRGKWLAALVPALVLAVPMSLAIAFTSPVAGLVAVVSTAAWSMAVVLMRLWNPAAIKRQDLFKRKNMGDPVTAVLEAFLPLVGGVAAYLLATASAWGIPAVLVGAAILAIGYARARGRGVAFAP